MVICRHSARGCSGTVSGVSKVEDLKVVVQNGYTILSFKHLPMALVSPIELCYLKPTYIARSIWMVSLTVISLELLWQLLGEDKGYSKHLIFHWLQVPKVITLREYLNIAWRTSHRKFTIKTFIKSVIQQKKHFSKIVGAIKNGIVRLCTTCILHPSLLELFMSYTAVEAIYQPTVLMKGYPRYFRADTLKPLWAMERQLRQWLKRDNALTMVLQEG